MKLKNMIIAQPCSKNVDQLLDIIKKSIKYLKINISKQTHELDENNLNIEMIYLNINLCTFMQYFNNNSTSKLENSRRTILKSVILALLRQMDVLQQIIFLKQQGREKKTSETFSCTCCMKLSTDFEMTLSDAKPEAKVQITSISNH
ncbi:CLUMA_CG001206, isoform A [Clunio marinus]|uniref:CLUMA_CG001206, isoform A n=1 Tax=Clunio marinus TaxID=568069 RepID=A0A1J1HJ18_9DIPT|nr:CLUMA_CG001206, isoform A [Clunio marinus]